MNCSIFFKHKDALEPVSVWCTGQMGQEVLWPRDGTGQP